MKVKKRTFLGLLLTAFLLLLGIIIAVFYLYLNRLEYVYRNILILLIALSTIIIIITALGLGGIVLTILSARTYPPLQSLIIIAVKILYPVALRLGGILGIPKDKIKSSFIEVNNHLVLTRGVLVPPEKILILVPHCLQKDFCPYKITTNIKNCHRCGKCDIDKLISFAEKYNVNIAVVSGGTLARRYVSEYRPRAIVAIACERDLTSGIQDTNPIPVIGILNERPEGPCFNCTVNLERVEKAIRFFINGKVV